MIQVLQIQVAVSDGQMIANWMPLSAAGLIRELCSLTLSRQLAVAAPNPCVFSKTPSFEFLNSCRLALLPGQNGVANRPPDVAGTQHRVSHGRQVAEPAVFAEVQSREAQSGQDAMCSVPTAHNVKAQGNALGKCETNVPSPNGAKESCPAYALSGLSCSSLPVSWGDAPGFHMVPRCGKTLRTRQPW